MLEVVAAIITNDAGEILIAKRKKDKSMGGLWEFPGGKVETEETPEESLRRELKEEMNIDIEVKQFFGESICGKGEKAIHLSAYCATIVRGSIVLRDHEEYCWTRPQELIRYAFPDADQPFVRRLMKIGV